MRAICYNGLALGAVAELEVLNCQPALMPNRDTALDLTTKPAIEPNACYSQCFLFFSVYP